MDLARGRQTACFADKTLDDKNNHLYLLKDLKMDASLDCNEVLQIDKSEGVRIRLKEISDVEATEGADSNGIEPTTGLEKHVADADDEGCTATSPLGTRVCNDRGSVRIMGKNEQLIHMLFESYEGRADCLFHTDPCH